MPLNAIREFFRLEAAGGILLVLAALLALVLDNSPLAPLYDQLLTLPVSIQIGTLGIDKPLLLWINDGLMAVFFLLVGLELKREAVEGQLSTRSQIMLPGIAAIGGMVVPAAVYAFFNYDDPAGLKGWAIPAATDIAFALGVLALMGSRVPLAAKVFLTALAIIDDIGAILVIAVFYTSDLSVTSLVLAGVGLAGLFILNRFHVARLAPYMIVGALIWVFVLKSGVHATLAGVAVALAIPMRNPKTPSESPLRHLEHILHPWVAYAILPLFAFANAGFHIFDLPVTALTEGIPMGIALGLLVGKQVGAFGFAWVALKLKLAVLPEDVSMLTLYGVCVLTGIGFTMSLFIGGLAFADPAQATLSRLGIVVGSLVSGLLGFLVLRYSLRRS